MISNIEKYFAAQPLSWLTNTFPLHPPIHPSILFDRIYFLYRSANMQRFKFENNCIKTSKFVNADMRNMDLSGVINWGEVNLTGADLRGSRIILLRIPILVCCLWYSRDLLSYYPIIGAFIKQEDGVILRGIQLKVIHLSISTHQSIISPLHLV